jgi:hypothetical protein
MLDVLHYFFEDDLNFSTAEQAEAREHTRVTLYRDLYDTEYKYAVGKSSSTPEYEYADDDEADAAMASGSVGARRERLPYVPPTDFNPDAARPFGRVLDGPLG